MRQSYLSRPVGDYDPLLSTTQCRDAAHSCTPIRHAPAPIYGELFGWRIEPGPSAGGYRIFTPTLQGGMHGGDQGASPLVFFGVADLEAAMARVRDLGGHAEALESRADEPREGSFGRFALCRDDQGSPFGLHQPPAAEGKGARGPAARRPTIDHVTLRARDLPASRRFYEAALAPLGFGLEFEHEGLLAFGSGESGRLIIYASERPAAGVHVAFSAPSRQAVDRFHAAALGRADATTARRGRGPSTTKATTVPTRSTSRATTSRRSTTPLVPGRTRREQRACQVPVC